MEMGTHLEDWHPAALWGLLTAGNVPMETMECYGIYVVSDPKATAASLV